VTSNSPTLAAQVLLDYLFSINQEAGLMMTLVACFINGCSADVV
jgi:hypothetical protein